MKSRNFAHSPRATAFGIALACSALASPAHAFYVSSSVSIGGGLEAGRAHNAATGVTTDYVTNSYALSGYTGGSTGVGGTTSTSLAFASYDPPQIVNSHNSYGYASANLSTGSLHAVSKSNGSYSGADAYARLDDEITFTTAGANAATRRSIVVDLHLKGSYAHGPYDGYDIGYNYKFDLYRVAGGVGPQNGGSVWRLVEGGFNDFKYGPGGWDSWEVLSGAVDDFHFRGTLTLAGASSTYALLTTFGMRCTSGANCDFGNSARLGFELPLDVSFTSGSGVLLTAAVPEPQSGALLLAGLGVLGWMALRRKAR